MAVQVPDALASGLNEDMVLLKAVRRAGEELGLKPQEIDQAIGKRARYSSSERLPKGNNRNFVRQMKGGDGEESVHGLTSNNRNFVRQMKVQIQSSMDPHTQQMIASVLRLHRSLSALVGGDITLMRHWMATANRHTGGVPREQLQDPGQLVKLVQYLDAMRGRP